jgi:hypothetical protein
MGNFRLICSNKELVVVTSKSRRWQQMLAILSLRMSW